MRHEVAHRLAALVGHAQAFVAGLRALFPIHDGHVQHGFARPFLRRDGIGNRAAVRHDVVQGAFAALVLAHRVGGHQAGVGIGGQGLVGLAKPVHAKVGLAGHGWVSGPQLVHIGRAKLLLHFVLALVGRVADDDLHRRPGPGLAVGQQQRVGAHDVGIEVVEGQGRLLVVALGGIQHRQLLGNHERHLGQLHGEGLQVEAVELVRAHGRFGADEVGQRLLVGRGGAHGPQPGQQRAFEQLHFLERHEQEVARAAGRVQHPVAAQGPQRVVQLRGRVGGLNAPPPRLHQHRYHHLQNVGFVGVVRAQHVSLAFVQSLLEDGAEDGWVHGFPVFIGRCV